MHKIKKHPLEKMTQSGIIQVEINERKILMNRFIIFGLCLLLFLTGCSGKQIPDTGDFSFVLPSGYTLADITAESCSITRIEDEMTIGGMELTALSKRDLNGKNTQNIINYLMADFHHTNDVEYLSSHWGKHHKIVIVHLDKPGNDGQEDHFSHIFFQKDSSVYHLWLDLNIVDYDTESQFKTMTGVD